MTRRKTHEEFVSEVKALVGDEYTVLGTYVNKRTKIDIHHEGCGKTNPVTPDGFLSGSRCPNCSSTAKKTTEKFKEEVFKLVKGEYEVISDYHNSKSRVDILHLTCGKVFPTTPNNFLRGRRCPKCFGKFKKTTEEFKKEVFKLVKEEYEVLSEYHSALSKIDILHLTCGEVYPVKPNNFLNGDRCPKCKESKGEREISQWLSVNLISFESQTPIRYKREKSPLFLDFYVQGVAIEYDGEYHYKPKQHAGGEEGLRHRQHLDRIKDKYCADNGIPLIRIPYWDFDNIDAILTEKLLPLLDASSTQKQAS